MCCLETFIIMGPQRPIPTGRGTNMPRHMWHKKTCMHTQQHTYHFHDPRVWGLRESGTWPNFLTTISFQHPSLETIPSPVPPSLEVSPREHCNPFWPLCKLAQCPSLPWECRWPQGCDHSVLSRDGQQQIREDSATLRPRHWYPGNGRHFSHGQKPSLWV